MGLQACYQIEKFKQTCALSSFEAGPFKICLDEVQRDDYLTSIVLTDAYFSTIDYIKYLWFRWKGHLYDFYILCFGLAFAGSYSKNNLHPANAMYAWMKEQYIYFSTFCLSSNNIAESRFWAKM